MPAGTINHHAGSGAFRGAYLCNVSTLFGKPGIRHAADCEEINTAVLVYWDKMSYGIYRKGNDRETVFVFVYAAHRYRFFK